MWGGGRVKVSIFHNKKMHVYLILIMILAVCLVDFEPKLTFGEELIYNLGIIKPVILTRR